MRHRWIPLAILAVLAFASLFVMDRPPAVAGGPIDVGDTAWMLTATGLVLLMTPGLAFFYAGMVSTKNVISTMLQSFIALGVITLVWVVVGFSLCFGDSIGGVIGDPRTYFMFRGVGSATHPALAPTIPFILFAMFQLKFAVITPALITGSFAERVRFSAYLRLHVPLLRLHLRAAGALRRGIRNGFLHKWGVLDFAGGTVVHMSAGFAALAGGDRARPAARAHRGRRGARAVEHSLRASRHRHAVVRLVRLQRRLGARRQRDGGDGVCHHAHGLGVGDARLDSRSTSRAAAVRRRWARASARWSDWSPSRRRRASSASRTASSSASSPASSATWRCTGSRRSNLDDTLDVFPCHGVGGIVGMLLTGVLARDVGLFWGPTTTFLYHLLALVIVERVQLLRVVLLFKVTDRFLPIRVTPEQEAIGLDLSQHGEFMELEPTRQFS